MRYQHNTSTTGELADLLIVSPENMAMFRKYWDKELAHRNGVTVAAIERFRALGWLRDDHGTDVPPDNWERIAFA